MKHPHYEILQDYFENVLVGDEEKRVKQHLLECDKCTKVLSHFVVLETKLQKHKEFTVTAQTKNKIFHDAKSLLQAKRTKIQQATDRKEWLGQHIQEWKESIFPELRIPALQFASLSLVLVVLISVEKSQGSYEEIYEPLSNDVTVFTAEE